MSTTIAVTEQQQITTDLYDYLEKIAVEGHTWHFELGNDTLPTLTFTQMSAVTKTKVYMGGDYEAALPFIITVRKRTEDTKGFIEITKPLNYLAGIFEQETSSNFPNLVLNSATPVNIEMTETPEQNTDSEKDISEFYAVYVLRYKKRGNNIWQLMQTEL